MADVETKRRSQGETMGDDIDLFTDYIDYLKSKEVAFAGTYMPYYLCSVGCHMLNIRQQKYEPGIYAELGRYPNLRLNTMMVAPPGFSKTFFIELMLDPDIGLIGGTNIPTEMVQNMTEAAFIGSSGGDEDQEYSPGIAEKYSDGIVGCEEFDTLIQVMQTDHSSNLDNMMLTALDSGRVRKSLANVDINYHTNITMFTATQPRRMDLTSGFSRRFLFLKFYPSPEEMRQIKESRRKGRGMDADFSELQKYKNELGLKFDEKIADIEEVRNVDALDKLFDKEDVPHYEEPIYERMAMGYSVLKADTVHEDSDGTVYLEVDPTRELRGLVNQAMEWRSELTKDVQGDQILQVLRGTDGGKMHMNELKEFMTRYSMDFTTSSAIIEELRKQGRVRVNPDPDTSKQYVINNE